jgi:hypothetical protein
MQRLRALARKLRLLVPEDDAPRVSSRGRPLFSRFAAPHTFGPDLSLAEALVGVAGCLARIFGASALFAVWGGASAIAWNGIRNRFWRLAAEPPLLLLFLAALAGLMMAVTAVERSILSHR